jgi:hypothetical protein
MRRACIFAIFPPDRTRERAAQKLGGLWTQFYPGLLRQLDLGLSQDEVLPYKDKDKRKGRRKLWASERKHVGQALHLMGRRAFSRLGPPAVGGVGSWPTALALLFGHGQPGLIDTDTDQEPHFNSTWSSSSSLSISVPSITNEKEILHLILYIRVL